MWSLIHIITHIGLARIWSLEKPGTRIDRTFSAASRAGLLRGTVLLSLLRGANCAERPLQQVIEIIELSCDRPLS
jgi:hypothetical protein